MKDFRSCRAGDVITLPGPRDELLVKTVRLRQGGIIPTVSPAVDDAPAAERLVTLTATTHPRKCR